MSKERIISALQDYYIETGKPPSVSTFKKISLSNICYHFGTWNKALTEAGLPTKKTPVPSQKVVCKTCGKEFKKLTNQIEKSKNNFCSRSCNASYGNKHKTTGTRRAKLEVWLETQLSKEYDLEIICNKIHSEIGYELDIYLPSLNLAFEINGIFHYEPIYGEEKLKRTQETDKNKHDRCNTLNINLISIDTRAQKVFKEKTSYIFLNLIKWEIENLLFLRSFNM